MFYLAAWVRSWKFPNSELNTEWAILKYPNAYFVLSNMKKQQPKLFKTVAVSIDSILNNFYLIYLAFK